MNAWNVTPRSLTEGSAHQSKEEGYGKIFDD